MEIRNCKLTDFNRQNGYRCHSIYCENCRDFYKPIVPRKVERPRVEKKTSRGRKRAPLPSKDIVIKVFEEKRRSITETAKFLDITYNQVSHLLREARKDGYEIPKKEEQMFIIQEPTRFDLNILVGNIHCDEHGMPKTNEDRLAYRDEMLNRDH